MFYRINNLFTLLYEILTYPVSFFSPFVVVLYWSVVSSFIILLIYKIISKPESIKKAKNQIKASIFAIRIYSDEPSTFLKSFIGSLYWTFRYFLLNLTPVLVLIVILFPLFAQLELRYGIKRYKEGKSFLVQIKFKNRTNSTPPSLEILNRDKLHTEVKVFIPELHEYNLKIKPEKVSNNIIFLINGEEYRKNLVFKNKGKLFPPKKIEEGSAEILLYPGEKPLKSDSVKEISLDTEETSINFLGLKLHWLIYYLILTIIIVLALKNRFGVEF